MAVGNGNQSEDDEKAEDEARVKFGFKITGLVLVAFGLILIWLLLFKS